MWGVRSKPNTPDACSEASARRVKPKRGLIKLSALVTLRLRRSFSTASIPIVPETLDLFLIMSRLLPPLLASAAGIGIGSSCRLPTLLVVCSTHPCLMLLGVYVFGPALLQERSERIQRQTNEVQDSKNSNKPDDVQSDTSVPGRVDANSRQSKSPDGTSK